MYEFEGAETLNVDNQCRDLSVLKIAAQFECPTDYSGVMFGADSCRYCIFILLWCLLGKIKEWKWWEETYGW